jgi:tripartite-type tricarboxylate transporter receptor subunit TctC
MEIRMKTLTLVFCAVLLFSYAGNGLAQNYPTKPIRIIVPYTPGGTTDMLARLVGQKMTESWGQQVIVDNRPGASGIIGAELTVKSAPDGYTLLLATSTTLCTAPNLYSKVSYNSLKDFAPVTLLVRGPNYLVVHPSVPAKSVKELIALAKSKPGQLRFASSGNGTSQHLCGELFKSMAGVDLVHIPYKGSAPALTDLLSGQVSLMFENMPTILPHVQAGKVRGLALTDSKRWPSLPDVPTIAESGLPGFEIAGFYGIVAPAGTPKVIIAKLDKELSRIITLPDIRERMMKSGFEPSPSTPEAFTELIKQYDIKNSKIIKEAGIKVE